MVFCFVQNYFFGQHTELEFFSPEFNIRLYDINSESDYFFFLHQYQYIFFSDIGNQNIFFRKKTYPPPPPPPPEVKWSVPYHRDCYNIST